MLAKLIEQSEQHDREKSDFYVQPSEVGFRHGRFETKSEFGPVAYQVEEFALRQIAEKLKVPFGYLQRCQTLPKQELFDKNLNTWLWGQRDKQTGKNRPLFIRSHGDNVRAFLSENYTPFDNTSVLTLLAELLDQAGGADIEVQGSSYVDRDNTSVRVLARGVTGPADDPDKPGQPNYGVGVYVHNGEIGNRSVMVAPFIQRSSCSNSTVWTSRAWRVAHVWHSEAWLKANFKEQLGRAFRLSEEMIDQVYVAAETEIPDLRDVVNRLKKRLNMSDTQKDLVMIGANEPTVMGVVNGLTFMAQRQDDQDRRLYYEGAAGTILGYAGKGDIFRALSDKQLAMALN